MLKVPWEGACSRNESLGYAQANVPATALLPSYRQSDGSRVVFLYAFAKNDKANISNKEKTALQLTAKDFLSATDKQLQALLSTKKYREVIAHEQNS
jgi:hypothetical protein